MARRYALVLVAIAAVLLGSLSGTPQAVRADDTHPPTLQARWTPRFAGPLRADEAGTPAGPVVVRIYVRDRDHLQAVSGRLDIWEVHLDEGYVVAMLQPDKYEWLRTLGYRLEIDAAKTESLNALAVLDPRYYYYDDNVPNSNNRYLVNFLQTTQLNYPSLVTVFDIGDAWQASHGGYHRDMWVMRITSNNPAYGTVASKPPFFLFAGVHAREVVLPELAIRYARYLTEGYNGQGGYNTDPDVNWLVNYHVIYILFTQNPDGHRVNEANSSVEWRKNLDNDDGCSYADSQGTDLNRNSSFFWGCCGGSSTDPCDETYRGPSAGSEPETQAFENYFATIIQDQNGPTDNNTVPPASPITTTGLFLSLHSYSDVVLWPWGVGDHGNSPNYNQLRTIGRRFAYLNGYAPDGWIGYDVDGATDDWTYGRFGIASFTIEAGPSYGTCGGFIPAYGCIDGIDGMTRNFWAENRPVLVYAHKIARTPYMTAYGPDALTPAVQSTTVDSGQIVTLTATVNDTRTTSGEPTQNIIAAEYYIDTPPWLTTTTPVAYPMAAVDGSFNSSIENVRAVFQTQGLSLGRHILFVRGKDADGNWGPVSAVFLQVTAIPNAVVTGVVRSGETGQPVEGALVRLTGPSTNLQQTAGASGSYSFTVYSNTYTLTASSPAYYPAQLTVFAPSLVTTTADITLTAIPSGTLSGFVREEGSGFPLAGRVHLVSPATGFQYQTDTDPATGFYSLSAMSDTYTITASANGHVPAVQQVLVPGNQMTSRDLVLALSSCVLLVDDDGGRHYEDYFTTALQQAGITFQTWTVASKGSPTAANLSAYPAVLWFTGDDGAGTTLSSQDRANLTSYLQGGGNLFLNGTEIGAGNSVEPFYTNWLATRYTDDDSGSKSLTGSGIFAGLNLDLNGGDSANDQVFPDAIEPRGSATSVFGYTNGRGGGVAYDAGSYRTLNLGFGVEGISTAQGRLAVVRDGLTWLKCAPLRHEWEIGLTPSSSTVWAQDRLTYTLQLTHTSALTATNVVVTDRLPAGLTFAGASHSGTAAGDLVTWVLPEAAPLQGLQLTLQVTVTRVPTGTVLVNGDYNVASDQTPSAVTGAPALVTVYNLFASHIEVSPASLDLTLAQGETATRTFAIDNQGTADLVWTAAENAGWLALAPSGATTAPGSSSTLELSLDASGLAVGVYTTTLRVASDDFDRPQIDVPITLTVTCTPVSAVTIESASAPPRLGQSFIFTGTAAGATPITYTWSFGDGSSGSGQWVNHTFPLTGAPRAYTVTLTAANACPSQDSAETAVNIQLYGIYLPLALK